jgi:hypothetical protein
VCWQTPCDQLLHIEHIIYSQFFMRLSKSVLDEGLWE